MAQDVTAQRPATNNPQQEEAAVANLPDAGGYIQTQAIGSVFPWKTPDGRIVWENPQATVEGAQKGSGLSGAEQGTQVGTSASQGGTTGKKKKGILPRKEDESIEPIREILPRKVKENNVVTSQGDNAVDAANGYGKLSEEQVRVDQEKGIIAEDEEKIELPKPPKPASLSDTETRRWYLDAEAQIPNLIDRTKPLEQQARQAFELRNQFRTQARVAMYNRKAAQGLEKTDPNQTWEQIVEKYIRKGFAGDALYSEIIKASTRSRTAINESLGIFPK